MVKWVCELDENIQNEIRNDARAILNECTDYTENEITEIIENTIMNEKLVNIIGYEEGMLDADKYSKYVFK